MATPPIPDHVLQEAASLFIAGGGIIEVAARKAGIPSTTFRRHVRLARERGFLAAANLSTVRTSVMLDGDGNVRQTSLTQAVERPPFTAPEGMQPSRVSALVDGEGRLINQWQRFDRAEQTQADLVQAIREAISEHRGAAPIRSAPDLLDNDLITLYPLPDLHIGALSWGAETGENWDLDIACQTIRRSMADLVAGAKRSRHAVVLGLGDYYHLNDRTNMTPRSGHVLDVDGRWPKVFKAGARMALDLIGMVADRHERVEVRFLPGNHDPDAAVTLAAALSLYFDGHDRITVNDSPSLHWYRRFGRVLMGATHGHTMKPERMAMMLAADMPEDWGQTKFRHFFFGHVHHESAKEAGAVKVESFNSPAAKDAHAHGGGWRSSRTLHALTFHATRGQVGRNTVNLTAFEDAA